ncbi:urease accessory protein UreE [Nereida sp. MMG025]|uniref:urease accessory protein UreE n=1 Tax=Nereida sp. MMG025 TaxID=2909981 RepID=UPI001F16AE25|nr:urease accessory protein UreE [Nereida sp. MMG025]MCF6444167.1 urease accessory protein UreE [Nereida sp. MMG025]
MVDFVCQSIQRTGHWDTAVDRCVLTYEERLLRRKVLTTQAGAKLLVDLQKATNIDHGDAFVLTDGRLIEVAAADEALLQITADNLLPLVWHIGNRHCPAQLERSRVLIQPDHVIRDLMERRGASVADVFEPFTPEGGAYGRGRTQGHAHSHDHSHEH